jgi:hypothetical protein
MMNFLNILKTLVKGKLLVTTAVGATLLVGSGIALAATSPGQQLVQNITGTYATVSPTQLAEKYHNLVGTATEDASKLGQQGNTNPCDALPEAQQLATKYSLSTDSNGNTVKLICSLHDGTFQVTVNGKSVTVSQDLGYGEIDQLMAYAKSMAAKDGVQLTDSNLQDYVANALSSCGSTEIIPCINSKLNANGQDNSGIPTPPADWKPTSIPTPPADWRPTSTATPHSNH